MDRQLQQTAFSSPAVLDGTGVGTVALTVRKAGAARREEVA